MAYAFQTNPTGSFQYAAVSNDRAFTLSQINARETDANKIITGMAGLFWIVNEHGDWEAKNGIRTIKQTVTEE